MKIKEILLALILIFIAPKVNADTTTGLIGWWRFDDGSGTLAVDSSGNANTGALNNAPAWTRGHLGKAISLNGTSQDFLKTGLSTTTTTNLSISMWVNVTSNAGGYAALIAAHNAGDDYVEGFNMDQGAAGSAGFTEVNFECASSNGEDNLMNASFAFGTWVHVALITPDGGGHATLYINGVQQKSRNACGSMSINNLFIGARHFGGSDTGFLNGIVDDVRIYNRVLSVSDILQLYNTRPISLKNARLHNMKVKF
jgi:hypothetical protein